LKEEQIEKHVPDITLEDADADDTKENKKPDENKLEEIKE